MTIREIETRELAKELLGGGVVGERGLNFGGEEPESNLAVNVNRGFPLSALAMNAFVFPDALTVAPVLAVTAKSDICPSVIKCQTIAVVHKNADRGAQDLPMHENLLRRRFAFRRIARRVNEPSLGDQGVPGKLLKRIEILIIDQRHAPFGQFDFARH